MTREKMPDYRWTKKPVTIEAWQLTEEIALNYWENKVLPPFGCKSISGEYNKNTKVVRDAYFNIDTLEGSMKASLGDWIIRGIKGEIYPCKPDIFSATYTLPSQTIGAEALEEIRERWKSRSWPSIGYFVHGQAYQDIQKLLEIIDEK